MSTLRYGSITSGLIDILKSAGERGISIKDLMIAQKTTEQRMKWRILHLRSKKHLNVIVSDGIAVLKPGKLNEPVEKRPYTKRVENVKLQGEALKDYLDMRRKEIFYGKCAKAILDVESEIEKFRKMMS